jgi:hypothetical protein
MSPLPLLSIVRMKGGRHRARGIEPGATGVVVDVYGDDAYEVEFSDSEGITIALLTLARGEFDLVSETATTPVVRFAD